ncbi:MAG: SirB2 family protein [Halioglobus sp.]
MFAVLKVVHIICALLSIVGFSIRGYWIATDNPLQRHRVSKTLPHIIDTGLLGSAIAMLVIWRISPFELSWLTVKIAALLVYIALGMVAMRFGKTKKIRMTAWSAAMLTALFIVSVAFGKTPAGFFALL